MHMLPGRGGGKEGQHLCGAAHIGACARYHCVGMAWAAATQSATPICACGLCPPPQAHARMRPGYVKAQAELKVDQPAVQTRELKQKLPAFFPAMKRNTGVTSPLPLYSSSRTSALQCRVAPCSAV